MSFWGRYLLALALTIVVETLLACLLRRDRRPRLLVDVPLMNVFTHPLLYLGALSGVPLALGEGMVIAAESLVYRRVTGLRWRWALGFGIGLNLVTWGLGAILPF